MEITRGKLNKPKKVVLYGPEGIGKSTFAAQFPTPIFIDTEGSTNEMDVARMPNPTSWTMLNQHIDWVIQNPHQLKTLVIDTIDWAEMMCVEAVCSRHNKKGIEDFGYGNGYVYTKEEFGRFLNRLSDVIDAGINVVLTAHSQIVKFEQPDEMGAYDRYQLKLGKKTSSQTAPLVKEWADMVLFMNYKTFSIATDEKGKKYKGQGGARTIYATHHPAWDAKNRHGLPDEFPMDFTHIAHIFNDTPQVQNTIQPTQQMQQPVQQTYEQPTQSFDKTQVAYQEIMTEQKVPIENNIQQHMQQPVQPMKQIDSSIPQALRDLMIENDVSEEEIQIVVGEKGYYPSDTPISNYDPNFVQGVLVGAWGQVFQMVEDFRKTIPFDI